MIIDHDGIADNIKSSSLCRMLVLKDISGHFWVRRARAGIDLLQ